MRLVTHSRGVCWRIFWAIIWQSDDDPERRTGHVERYTMLYTHELQVRGGGGSRVARGARVDVLDSRIQPRDPRSLHVVALTYI